jgi:hypothetical protein
MGHQDCFKLGSVYGKRAAFTCEHAPRPQARKAPLSTPSINTLIQKLKLQQWSKKGAK